MRQLHPQVIAARRAGVHGEAQACQCLLCRTQRTVQPGLETAQMAPVLARRDQLVHHALYKIGRGHHRHHLQVTQRIDAVRRPGDVAHAQTGRQRFGKAAHVDHALQLVQRGQAWGVGRLQVGKWVVLHHQEPIGRSHLQHAVRLGQADRPACGVVRQRLREEHLGPVLFQQRLQRIQVGAIGQPGHAQHLHLGELELAKQRVVAG
ncbi:hypothetical protein D3C71_1386620 [compost metagenome]